MTETPSDYYWCYRHQLDVRSAEDRELHKAAAGPRDDDVVLWEASDSDHLLKVGAITREGGRYVLWSGSQRVWTGPAEAAAGPRDEGLPTLDELRRMRAHEVNAFFAAHDIDWRVAAAGPRDEAIELCPECGGQYSDLAGHRRFAHNVPGWRNESVEAWDKASAATREAAAGPREYHDLSAAGDILGHGHSYAEAAAGPRDVELPPEFVGFLVGEFMRAGFHKEPRAAQADARHIVESWNSRALAKASE
jgi:hypothetical protein